MVNLVRRRASTLERAPARSAAKLLEHHDDLCLRRAWPKDAGELEAVEEELTRFQTRSDVRRFRTKLVNSGIAGTDLSHRFYFNQALRLAKRWPTRLHVDWDDFDNEDGLLELLALLMTDADSLALDSEDRTAREWLSLLKSPSEADGAFLVTRFAEAFDHRVGEFLFERLDPPLTLAASEKTPSRTTAWHARSRSPVHFGAAPAGRPLMPQAFDDEPVRVRRARPTEGRALLALARDAMLVRLRDIDAFAYGNPADVVLVDWPAGMQFAIFGMVPDRRLLIESCFGHLVLQNGVPVGYGTLSALFESVEIAYNIFPVFRGHGAPWVMARLLATARHLFDAKTAYVGPYQLGQDNEEGLRSGAWWYYEKLGFRPDAPEARRLWTAEKRLLRNNPRHRTSLTTLRRLADHPMFFNGTERRAASLGRIDLGALGDAISKELARDGAHRSSGLTRCVTEVRALLGLQSLDGWSANARRALSSLAPLVLSLSNVSRWPATDRLALAEVIRAKGSVPQADFVRRFDAHERLRAAILALTQPGR